MKNTLKLLVLATGMLVAQSCGPKKNNEATAETAVAKKEVHKLADKKAKIEKQRAERAERRKIEHEKLAMNTPSYTDANGNVVYNKAENEPSFVGGDKAMTAFLKDNLKYPQDALNTLRKPAITSFVLFPRAQPVFFQ